MAAGFKIRAQLAVVVNLAVKNYRHAVIFVESWLLAGEQIDYRQTSHAERDAVVEQIAFRIRPPMLHAVAHRAQELFAAIRRRRARIEIGPTGYAAHNSVLKQSEIGDDVDVEKFYLAFLLDEIIIKEFRSHHIHRDIFRNSKHSVA